MKKHHFFIACLFSIVALGFSNRKQLASTWAGTASNEAVTLNALADAIVNVGVFEQRSGFSPSVQACTRSMLETYVWCKITGSYSSNQLVYKSDIQPAYYINMTLTADRPPATPRVWRFTFNFSRATKERIEVQIYYLDDGGSPLYTYVDIPQNTTSYTYVTDITATNSRAQCVWSWRLYGQPATEVSGSSELNSQTTYWIYSNNASCAL